MNEEPEKLNAQKFINEFVEKYNQSYSAKKDLEEFIALFTIKTKNEVNNFNNNISTNLCQLCRNSQRN